MVLTVELLLALFLWTVSKTALLAMDRLVIDLALEYTALYK